MRIVVLTPFLSLIFGAIFLAAPSLVQAQGTSSTLTLNQTFSSNFSGVSIAGAVNLRNNMPLGSGQITQIAFAPGNDSQVYVATFENGIWRYDYDPTSVNFFSNGVKVVQDSVVASPPSPDPRLGTGNPNGSLGIAFHDDPNLGTVMYLAPAVAFGGGVPSSLANVQRQRIVRLTDAGGNGVYGDEAADVNQIIVDNVWVNTHHEINQLQVIGNSLYAAVGTRTSFGGTGNEFPGETAYSGAVNFIEDLTAIPDTTTTNVSGFDIPDFNSDGVINDFDAQVDSQPFGSTDVSKLRVFSTGMRNIYGIAFDDGGNLFISMNEENSDGPDKLYLSQFRDDHLFPKQNELVGDWKIDGDEDTSQLAFDPSSVALGNGYFTNFVTPFAESGQRRSSFGGLDFISELAEDENLRGNILVSQSFDAEVVVMFDRATGAELTMLDGSESDRILEIQTDPFGNLLVAGQLGRVTLVTVVETVTEPEPVDPTDLVANAAGDYVAAAGSPTNILAAPPTGWSYLGSDAANGGAEFDLFAGVVGNQGSDYRGFVGTSGFNTAAVYGTNTTAPADFFEIFNNGANGAVVGDDLLLHPGQGGNADEFVIARYTVSATDLVAGSGAITGSFRELNVGGGAAAESVDVFVFHNSTELFNVQGGTAAQGTQGILQQTAGTFNLTGLTLAAGDTIDFVVGINGHFGADETALQANISAETPSDCLLGDVDLSGTVDFLDIAPFIATLTAGTFQCEADIDENDVVDFLDIAPFIAILTGS